MIAFERTIGQGEIYSGYLNLTDDYGQTYGEKFPADRTPLLMICNGSQYKASKRGVNQIWGALKNFYIQERVNAGDTIQLRYDPSANEIEGRVPIEIIVLESAGLEVSLQSTEMLSQDESVEETEGSCAFISIQMERDLEEFLVNNLTLIEEGLQLYIDENEQRGRQYQTEIGVIDLLCRKNNSFVVIELKKGRTNDSVVGQISRYIGWIKENLAEGEDVRGIIIAHDYDRKLRYAVLGHNNIQMKYYEIQIKFISEEQAIEKAVK